jgi:hypothetical protein
MEERDIAALAPLYDAGFQSFEPDTLESKVARADFHRFVEECWRRDSPQEAVSLREYRAKCVAKCREWLKKN